MPEEYFLLKDLNVLDGKIKETKAKIDEALKEIGISCQQGSETSHDNPGYEEGQRAVDMWAHRLQELVSVRQNAVLVDSPTVPSTDARAKIGHVVVFQDLITHEQKKLRLGSSVVFGDFEKEISYKSPIGQVLLGAMIGDILEPTMGREKKKWLILDLC